MRSSFETILLHVSWLVKSWILNIAYLSLALSGNRHNVFYFGTPCRGEHHSLFEGCFTPRFAKCLHSCLAILHLLREKSIGPVLMPYFLKSVLNSDSFIAWYLNNISENLQFCSAGATLEIRSDADFRHLTDLTPVFVSINDCPLRSINRL